MFQKKLFVIVSLLVIVAMIAGCAAPAAAPTQAPAQATAAPAQPTAAPAQPTGGDEKYVGFVPPALTSPFHVAMSDGAKAAADAAGWKLEVQAPASEGDFQAFVTTVQQLLEKGVKGLSINPIGTDSAVTAVKAANAKGVPILAHNFITPFSEGDVTSYIGYDQWGGAEKLAKYTCDLLAKKYNSTPAATKGKVFILLGIDSIFSHRRTGGFKAGLQKYCPNVVVAGEQTAEWLRTKGQEVAAIAWQKDPDIDVFYGNSDEMAIGAALAGEQLGKQINKDFFAVGIDGNQPTLDLLKQGKFSATLGVDPARMGETVFKTLQKVLAGEKVPQIILTPSVVVTPENLPDYLAGKLWTEPVAGAPELDNDKPTVPDTESTGGEPQYVGFVPPALTSPFHVAMSDGAKAAADAAGWKLEVQAPASEGDFQAFVTTVQQLLEKGVKGLSINPIGTDSAVTAVKAANAKGVPILAHNFITPFSEGDVTSYIGYDQWGGAEQLAKYTCELLAKKYNSTPAETKGQVFILLGIDSIFSHRRTGGFKAGLQKYCPNVVVAGEQTAEWLRTKGQEVAAIAWQKNPDIDVFYGNSDEMAIGAALAGEQLGKKINQDFFAVGIDGNQPTLDLLQQGKFSATLGVDPARMGETVFKTLQKVLAGEKVPQIILTPSVVVTPDNLADYLAGKLWTEPVAGAPELDNDLPTVP
jgi:ribose transport system substrate-binding protein